MAAQWLEGACNHGHAVSLVLLGHFHILGEGVRNPDRKTAVAMFKQAAEQGEPSAQVSE